MSASDLETFDRTGAIRLAGAAFPALADLEAALAGYPDGASGTRIQGDPKLAALLDKEGAIAAGLARFLGRSIFPVRAVFFDKNDTNNWALSWHQDRTIAVKSRHEMAEFTPWTLKQGMLHVQPPFEVIAGLRTARIHLDAVPGTNAPLKIALGSHSMGLIAAERCHTVAQHCEVESCLAECGDVWLYHTPILHSSDRSEPGQRRRVLQVDYADSRLPAPLEWAGV